MRSTIVLSVGLVLSVLAGAAFADIHIGTATGGIAVYYNTVGQGLPDEQPAHQAYFRAQFNNSTTLLNGAQFSFDPVLVPVFGDVGQFGLDLIVDCPTRTIALPGLNGVDYTPPPPYVINPTSMGPMPWGINDYKPGGVANNSAQPVNTVLKGMALNITTFSATPLGGYDWQATFGGTLTNDGYVHWFLPGMSDTNLALVGLPNWGYFSGTLKYLRAQDTTPGMDFYAGSIDFYAVPAPGAALLGMIGLGLVGWVKRRLA